MATSPHRPRSALVTAGTSAIGSAIVRALAAAGDSVTFTYRSKPDAADRLAAECGATACHLDLERDWTPPALDIDVLVNNAGISLSGHAIWDTPDEDLQRSLTVNYLAPVRLIRHYSAGMRERGFGRIVNINSLYGLTAPARTLGYTASKHALRAATRSLAQELAPYGITVNDVCPGPVDSEMVRSRGDVAVAAGRVASIAAYLDEFAARVPLGRLIAAEEIAQAVAFLTGEGSAALTGLAVRVDGGMLNV